MSLKPDEDHPSLSALCDAFAHAPAALCLLKLSAGELVVRGANAAFEELAGLPTGGARGRALRKLFPAMAMSQIGFAVEESLAGGRRVRVRLAEAPGDAPHRLEVGIQPCLTREGLLAVAAFAPLDHPPGRAQLAESIALAELQERRRIGRELHDSMAQLLLAARLALNALEQRGELSVEELGHVEEARAALAAAQDEIRSVSFALHPPSLDEDGLEQAVRGFLEGFGKRTGLRTTIQTRGRLERLPSPVKATLFRVLQEGLMNVYRHAQARSVAVRLTFAAGRASLEVEDDGAGMSQAASRIGVGIAGMRARMRQIGGDLEILTPSRGLKIRATAKVSALHAEEPARLRPPGQAGGWSGPPDRLQADRPML